MRKKVVFIVANVSVKLKWLNEPEDHDYAAVADYLDNIAPSDTVKATVAALKKATIVYKKAKDILRSARLDLLPKSNFHVSEDLKKINAGKKISPILLVRGDFLTGTNLQIGDGYHRVCASYHISENTDIPCKIVDWHSVHNQ